MIEISTQTAIILYAFCFLVGMVITELDMLFWKETKFHQKEIRLFYTLGLIGSLLIVFRENLTLFISIIVANSLILIAYMFLVLSYRIMVKIKVHFERYLVFLLLYVLLFVYFTYIDFNTVARVYVFNIAILVLLTYEMVRIILHRQTTKDLIFYIYFVIVFFSLMRVVNMFFNTETSVHFLDFQIDPLFIVLVGIANLLTTTGYLSIIKNYQNSDLAETERSKSSLLSNLPGFAYRCKNDEFWTMEFLSEGFKSVTGYDIDEVLHNKVKSYEELICFDFKRYVRDIWEDAVNRKMRSTSEYMIENKEKGKIWVLEQGIPIYDENDNCIAIEGFIMDINSRKNMQDELEYLSFRDSLTGLYNRRFIEDQITRLNKSRTLPISMIMGDINGLKFINDSFGHNYGDEAIQTVASILLKCTRGDGFVSRLGGDEFLIILENSNEEVAKKVIERIHLQASKETIANIKISISLGHATKTSFDVTLQEILKEAEDMMYRQKIYQNPSARRKPVDAVLGTLFEKDNESEIHSRNVSRYSKKLARAVGLSAIDVRKAETAGLLHDVGKIIVDTTILKSSSVLTTEEYEEIKKHPDIGFRILGNVEEFKDIANIILCHHERIDGEGYPNQVKGEDIPYISKIISICDAFEAMTHDRRYKDKVSKDEAFAKLRRNAGTQFDTNLVEEFITLMKNDL